MSSLRSNGQHRRYERQIVLPEVGSEGQERLLNASVLVVGAGGLGVPVLQYLAAAGVGTLRIVDPDVVEETNLHRQVLYSTGDLGRSKVDVVGEKITALNPDVTIEALQTRFDKESASELLSDIDLVVDGTDTFATRYAVNDACVAAGTPNVHASIARFTGQASVFSAPDGPCYRCLYPAPPPVGSVPSCAEGGVLGVLPGLLGMVQATEAVKWILGLGKPLVGKLYRLDALTMESSIVSFERDPDCPVCGQKEPDQTATPIQKQSSSKMKEITVEEFARLKDNGNSHFLLDVRQPQEHDQASIGGTLIPLRRLPSETEQIPNDRPVVVLCHHGGRSAKAVAFLREKGFDAINLRGGIHAWSCEVDSSVPTY